MAALNEQVGGAHYKDLPIQPAEYTERNKLTYLEGAVVKYITRWRSKNGLEDLEKAKHCIDLIIEINELRGDTKPSPGPAPLMNAAEPPKYFKAWYEREYGGANTGPTVNYGG